MARRRLSSWEILGVFAKATGNSRELGAGSVEFEIEVRSPSARIASAGNGHEKSRRCTKKSFCDFSCLFVATSRSLKRARLPTHLLPKYGRSAPPHRVVAELRCPIGWRPPRAVRLDRRRPSKSCLTTATGFRGLQPKHRPIDDERTTRTEHLSIVRDST